MTAVNRISVSGHIVHDIVILLKTDLPSYLECSKAYCYTDLRNTLLSKLVNEMSDFIAKHLIR